MSETHNKRAAKLEELADTIEAIKAPDYEFDATELFAVSDAVLLRQVAATLRTIPDLRDYFAAKAMPPLLADYIEYAKDNGWDQGWREGIARDAYRQADAMLKARALPAPPATPEAQS